MKNFDECGADLLCGVDAVLCDLDDTLTLHGKLPAQSYAALESLRDCGRKVVVVTGRPAGWCDLMARLWPIDGVVGENGAFYFRYAADKRQMIREFVRPEEARRGDRASLMQWFAKVRRAYPEIRLASDQDYRVSDVAIDVCEDVEPLPRSTVMDIMSMMKEAGATVKLSSIHINAWVGAFDKLTMAKRYLVHELGVAQDALKRRVLYVGDSPNDEPMFRFFDLSVGVQNIMSCLDDLEHLPAYVTDLPGGLGFAQIAGRLVACPPRDREP